MNPSHRHMNFQLTSLDANESVSVMRKALKDLIFSDGTKIPAGTVLVAPVTATHQDEENYADAMTFDPWRFLKMQEQDKDANETKYQYSTTAPEYVTFGHGRHAWYARPAVIACSMS